MTREICLAMCHRDVLNSNNFIVLRRIFNIQLVIISKICQIFSNKRNKMQNVTTMYIYELIDINITDSTFWLQQAQNSCCYEPFYISRYSWHQPWDGSTQLVRGLPQDHIPLPHRCTPGSQGHDQVKGQGPDGETVGEVTTFRWQHATEWGETRSDGVGAFQETRDRPFCWPRSSP